MIGKKIGTFNQIFKPFSDILKMMVMAVFEKEDFQALAGKDVPKEYWEKMFQIKVSGEINSISVQYSQNKLVVKLNVFREPKKPDAKLAGAMFTINAFVIDLKTLNVYSSEY